MLVLEAKNLKKSFTQPTGERVEILRGLNLQVRSGDRVTIMGPSGAGKSTLLTLLAGLDTPDSGELFLAGRDLSRMDPNERSRWRAQHVGVVFQSFHLIPQLTALENIQLALDFRGLGDAKTAALRILEQLGLAHRAHSFPTTMSRGENQRVAIGRVLAVKPALILADEPTGSLDRENAFRVMELLRTLLDSQCAFVLVTHDPEMAEFCGRRLLLKNGELIS